jgi:hypothetical protein
VIVPGIVLIRSIHSRIRVIHVHGAGCLVFTLLVPSVRQPSTSHAQPFVNSCQFRIRFDGGQLGLQRQKQPFISRNTLVYSYSNNNTTVWQFRRIPSILRRETEPMVCGFVSGSGRRRALIK